jgi:histone demethylase JARID1
MNPGRLKEAGVPMYACDQRPNEFVITFPKAYHCGFNHGVSTRCAPMFSSNPQLNFNEAVNFALPDWLAHGKESVERYREHAKQPVFSHEELVITITLYSSTIETALW